MKLEIKNYYFNAYFLKKSIICFGFCIFLFSPANSENNVFIPERHFVKSGDSLMRISNLYFNTHNCWKEIFEYNKAFLVSPDIEVGQVIFIPPKVYCKKAIDGKNANNHKKKRAWKKRLPASSTKNVK